MLHNQYLGVLAARTEEEFRAELGRFASKLGFRAADSLAVIDQTSSASKFFYVSSDDRPEWLSIDPSYWRRDPVMQHSKTSSVPIVWGARNYATSGLEDIHEVLVSNGMRSGINVCAHLRGGRHFAVALNTDIELLEDRKLVAHALPQLQLFAVHALDSASRLFFPQEECLVGQFTRKEVDVLSWVLDGKSTSEIADLLNLSEDFTVAILAKVTKSLDCANEHQAALKALRLGLIY